MPRLRGTSLPTILITTTVCACSAQDFVEVDNPAVGAKSAALRDMSPSEAREDLEQIFSHVRRLYGPYEYKENRFGYSIAELEDEARAMLTDSPGDDGFYSTAFWFLTRLRDGHVNLQRPLNSNPVIEYSIGLVVQPVEGKALIGAVLDPSLDATGIGYGDEVVAVDGVSPFAMLDDFLKVRTIGNEISDQHWIVRTFLRPAFVPELQPVSPVAHVELRRGDGSEYSRDLVWTEAREQPTNLIAPSLPTSAVDGDGFLAHGALGLNVDPSGSIVTIGATRPFFVTPPTQAVFNITEVSPNAAMLAKYELESGALPDIYTALYSFAGKSVLMVRQSGYSVPDPVAELNYYRAIMNQYDDFVDGLVVDQTHNPGGFLDYCAGFARLFATQSGHNFVQANNADRSWVNTLKLIARAIDPAVSTEESRNYELRASLVEASYDAGESIAAPMPLIGDKDLPPDASYVWTKPMLVLIDELAGSCGDVFPMLIKNNGIAPLFGRRTMGLGGNVEAYGPLPNSDAEFRLTRGLFTTHRDDGAYSEEDFVENRGIAPDIEHEITVDDFRGGFVGYMTHFSEELVAQIDAVEQQAQDAGEQREPDAAEAESESPSGPAN